MLEPEAQMFEARYENQTAIVTGGASGIGAAVAERLAREGARVCLFDANAERLRAQAAQLAAGGLQVETAVADVTDESSVRSATAGFAERAGRLDVLVHCVGIVGPTAVNAVDYPVEEFRRVIDINLCGSFITTRCVLPHMLAREYGRILLVASMAGKDGNPGMAGYASSKAGVIGLVKALGKEYATRGITINGVAPAVIATPMNAATAPEMLQQLTSKIPMQRLGTVDETAALIAWICSREASFNTGFVFDLSGGRATY
jgi:NAD(P)-dependent dehydrogenase (short-subunit alcohol dehydrogenase family)